MEFKKETSRFYYFAFDGDHDVSVDGVSSNGNEIKFPKQHGRMTKDNRNFPYLFSSKEQCEGWFKQYMEHDMKFAPMGTKIAKEIPRAVQKQVDISDAMWDSMQKHMVVPDAFDKSDFEVFESQLANTAPDRDDERFTKEFLGSLMKTLVGKSKLTGHKHDTIPEGVFFDTSIQKYSVDDFIETVGIVPDKGYLKKLHKIADSEGGIYWGIAKYYMHSELHKDKITRIKTGEAAPMSIGFRAPIAPIKVVDEADENEVLYWEWDNGNGFIGEAVEASDVYLGAQYGARNRKDFMGEESPVKIEKESGETAENIDSGKSPDGDETEHKPEEELMKMEVKVLDFEGEIEIADEAQEKMTEVFDAINDSVAEVVADLDSAKSDLEIADVKVNDVKAVFGDEYKKEDLEAAKEAAENYTAMRKDAEDWVIKAMHFLGEIKVADIDSKRGELSEKSVDELFEVRKSVTDRLAEKDDFNPSQLSGDYDFEGKQAEEPEEKPKLIRQSAYTLD